MGTSDFLFTRPSIMEGMMRVLDLGDTMTEFNRSLSDNQADALALRQDWNVVGDDLREALSVLTTARDEK